MTPLIAMMSLLGTVPFVAQGASPPHTSGRIVLRRCSTEYGRSSKLGVGNQGVLQDSLVKLGDRVSANQVLGRLFDREIRAEMELHKAKAESDLSIKIAQAKHAQTLAKLKNSNSLKTRNMVSAEEYELHRLEAITAEMELAGAKFEVRLNEIRYQQAESVARSREIVSPHDGVVVAIFKNRHEAVMPTEPVFHVVEVDRLRVTGQLDIGDAWKVRPGQRVEVHPEIGGTDLDVEKRTFPGTVLFVDRIIEEKTQTCRVVMEVENQEDLLRAGLEVRTEILLDTPDGKPLKADHTRSIPHEKVTTSP